MIPVTQTKTVVRTSEGKIVVHGNCYAAAIASVMELPITDVPNVEVFFDLEGDHWQTIMHTFLEGKGWGLFTDDRFRCFHPDLRKSDDWLQHIEELKGQYYFVSGLSSRGVHHICIYQNGYLVHDPHPSREGLITLEVFQTLEKQIN